MRRGTATAAAFLTVLAAEMTAAQVRPFPIPQGSTDAPAFIGAAVPPAPVKAPAVPAHPFMAPNGRSNIHDDAYMTDTYRSAGPLGPDIEVRSTYQQAECASVTFDRRGRILTICVGVEGPRLVMMDPQTLEQLAVLPLPPRQGGSTQVFSEFAGGGYFYLDHLDRAVIPTMDRRIFVVAEARSPAGEGFEIVQRHDLSSTVPRNEGIVSVLPDWSGRLWWVSSGGLVGTIDPQNGTIRSLRLEGENIANSFAVDETGGVFIVSDHALYRFDAAPGGEPQVTWRKAYDRGERLKPGQVSRGSGTTPTLMGKRLVAITDNADPKMHVLVYRRDRRGRGGPVCRKAVFDDRQGATDNSLIGTGRSLIVENNYGYGGPTTTQGGASTTAGLARIDLNRSGRGCRIVWTSQEHVPSVVPKLSLANGLVYVYTKEPDPDDDLWYLTAISFRTGTTAWKRLAGEGLGYNNNWAPVSLGPDGTGYVGALGGLVLLRDR
jgi:hypothetical protein